MKKITQLKIDQHIELETNHIIEQIRQGIQQIDTHNKETLKKEPKQKGRVNQKTYNVIQREEEQQAAKQIQ